MKRFISAFLSLVMAISLLAYLPIRAYAVDITNYVLTYPVTKSHKRLSRGYSTDNEHFAIDILPSPNSSSKTKDVEVMATCDGVVIKVYTGCNNWSGGSKNGVNCKNAGICSPSDGYGSGFCNIGLGNGVIIYHPSTKTYSAYGHMMKDSITVKAGDKVVAGQLIGYMGSCGWSTGKHLHFEIVYSTASSPSLSDYKYNRFTTKNCVNTNPYGDISVGSSASRDPDNIYYNFLDAPSVGGPNNSKVTIEPYSNKTAGTTGDKWLYPAFKVTVPNYKNSKISTVGYSVYTASGDEMFRFQETYRSGVNQDGTSYKNTFFGARTDGEANMDLEKDVYNIKREYLTDLRFLPGHNYFVRGFVVFDGKRYESNGHWMKTTGIGDQHMYDDGYVAAEPTCIYEGVMKYICRMCGCSKTEPIPPKGHTPDTSDTCVSPQKCIDCGIELAPLTGHKWDSGTMLMQPDCTTGGVKRYTCTVCGTPDTEFISALGHNYSGNFWYASHPHEQYQKCTRCSAEKKTGSTKKLDSCSICYPTFTITYNANGGSGAPASQTKSSGKALTLSSAKPTRQGYTFLGWATSSGASSAQYNAGGSFTTDANTTLYAVWRKDTVTTGAQIVVGNVTAAPGSTVMVPIEIKNNPGVMSVSFRMRYPNSAITLVDSGAKSLIGTSVSNPNFGLMPYPYSWYRPKFDNFTGDAILATPKFKISQNAPEGIYDIVIEYDPKVNEIVDKNNQNINFEVVVGQITVSKVLCGDVDKNGVVNMLDGIAIMKYYNKWTGFETGSKYNFSNAVADVDGNGVVNMLDGIAVMKHYNKWSGFETLPLKK